MSERLRDVAGGKAEPKGGFSGWIAGRCRRREYWLWTVPWFIAVTAVAFVAPGTELILGPVMLFIWIRRLHDLGLTGWMAPLINIAIGVVGWIEVGVMSQGGGGGAIQGLVSLAAIVALGAIPGQSRANPYGAHPGRRPDLAETFS